MRKDGFTLIELLAVIVILAILMLVAGANVFGILDNAQKGAFKTEFLELLNASRTKAQIDIMNGKITGNNPTKCYNISDLGDYFDNKNDYVGHVDVTYVNGKLSITGSMSSDKHIIENKGEDIDTDTDIKELTTGAAASLCP